MTFDHHVRLWWAHVRPVEGEAEQLLWNSIL
jgi:hypothetical protein